MVFDLVIEIVDFQLRQTPPDFLNTTAEGNCFLLFRYKCLLNKSCLVVATLIMLQFEHKVEWCIKLIWYFIDFLNIRSSAYTEANMNNSSEAV